MFQIFFFFFKLPGLLIVKSVLKGVSLGVWSRVLVSKGLGLVSEVRSWVSVL